MLWCGVVWTEPRCVDDVQESLADRVFHPSSPVRPPRVYTNPSPPIFAEIHRCHPIPPQGPGEGRGDGERTRTVAGTAGAGGGRWELSTEACAERTTTRDRIGSIHHTLLHGRSATLQLHLELTESAHPVRAHGTGVPGARLMRSCCCCCHSFLVLFAPLTGAPPLTWGLRRIVISPPLSPPADGWLPRGVAKAELAGSRRSMCAAASSAASASAVVMVECRTRTLCGITCAPFTPSSHPLATPSTIQDRLHKLHAAPWFVPQGTSACQAMDHAQKEIVQHALHSEQRPWT